MGGVVLMGREQRPGLELSVASDLRGAGVHGKWWQMHGVNAVKGQPEPHVWRP